MNDITWPVASGPLGWFGLSLTAVLLLLALGLLTAEGDDVGNGVTAVRRWFAISVGVR